jgi:hypothetical protein
VPASFLSRTQSTATTYRTTHTVALPSGRVTGDHLVLSFGIDGDGGTISSPSGATWQLVHSVDLNTNQKWRVWVRRLNGTESSTVTITTTGSNQSAAEVLHIRGGYTSDVEGTGVSSSTGTTSGYGTNVDPDSVTAAWGSANQLFVAMIYAAGLSPSVTAYPGPYSNGGNVAARAMVGSATRTTTATTEDPAAFTISSSNNHRAVTLVIRTAAAVTAGAQVATGTGAAHNATTRPPTTRAAAQVATGTGTAHFVRTPRRQVPSNLIVEWDFDNDLDFDETVEDITSYVRAGSIRVGRDYPSQVTGRSRPGEMRFTLDNTDGRFNYFNTASPLAVAPYSLQTGRLIRVRTSESTPTDPVLIGRDRFGTIGSLGTDELGNSWTTVSGGGWSSFTTSNDRATAVGPGSASGVQHAAYIDAGGADYYAQVVIPWKDAVNRVGLVYHYVDSSNYGYCYLGDGVIYAYEVVAGVHIEQTHDGAENRDDVALGVAVNDDALRFYLDGVQVLSTTWNETPNGKIGLYGRWYYQRPPTWSEFYCWNRSRIVQSWDTGVNQSGVLATMRVTKVVPTVVAGAPRLVEVTATGDLGLLDRPVDPPSSTGPDSAQSFGVKAGQMIGNVLHRVGALHPPGPIDGGVITLGPVGMDRQKGISLVRQFEDTELGFLFELPEGGIGFDDRDARTGSAVVATFTDDPAVLGYSMQAITQRDWQGDIINDVTAEVSGQLPRFTYFTDFDNQVPGPCDIDITLPSQTPHADGADVGDLVIVSIASTVSSAGVSWITPAGWTSLRLLNDEASKQRIYAKRLAAGDFGASVKFYDDTTPAGGAWQSVLFLVKNWYGSISSGVAVAEHTGYGSPSTTTQARAGDNDPPVMFTPWPPSPTLFLALRAGMTSTAGASMSASTDDQAPNGFDSLVSVLIDAASGGPAYDCAQQFARRIRTEQVVKPSGFGGTFLNFNQVETTVIAVRGYVDDPPPAGTRGRRVRASNADSQEARAAVLAHPSPGLLFATDDDADDYNDAVLTRYAEDRPILTVEFSAVRDARHRSLAASTRLSDRVRVDANGNAGLGVDAEFFVETITHQFSDGTSRWSVAVDLSPATDAGGGAD